MDLTQVQEGIEYIIRDIVTDDEELDAFLFSLGCYSGEPITVVSRKKGGCVVAIKEGRYSIDTQLAAAILVEAAAVITDRADDGKLYPSGCGASNILVDV